MRFPSDFWGIFKSSGWPGISASPAAVDGRAIAQPVHSRGRAFTLNHASRACARTGDARYAAARTWRPCADIDWRAPGPDERLPIMPPADIQVDGMGTQARVAFETGEVENGMIDDPSEGVMYRVLGDPVAR